MPYANVETLLEFVKNNTPNINGKTTMVCVERAIKEAPTADVAEVVYCKDCKYSREQDKVFEITDYKCLKHNISCLSPCDFCSYGEREEAKGDVEYCEALREKST